MAALTSAVLLASVIGSILSGGIQAGATVVGGAASTAVVAVPGMVASGNSGTMGYFVDSLFRRNTNAASSETANLTSMLPQSSERTTQDAAEVSRIFMNISVTEPLLPEDMQYVGQLVAQRTGLSQQDAEKRVTDVYARAQLKLNQIEMTAKEATDQARKASAFAALWMFVSLLIGAFVASLAATYGGRQRDA